ncbi:MAG: peptidase U62 [Elusimicrobia bacterium]|nr:peptidase U62 [Elusimicrobiota bacterium]
MEPKSAPAKKVFPYFLPVSLFFFLAPPSYLSAEGSAKDSVILSAMKKELNRSFEGLKNAEKSPMYFLGYEIYDEKRYGLSVMLGAVTSESQNHERFLDADVRLGSPGLDNTHQIKGEQGWYDWPREEKTLIATQDDETALRADIWLKTEQAFKNAANRLTRVETNRAVTAKEEDPSDDFSMEKPSRFFETLDFPKFDRLIWRSRLKELSLAFKKYPFIINSNVSLGIRTANRYLVNSEGSEIATGNRYVRLSYYLAARTEDGMDIERFESYDVERPEDLPANAKILEDIEQSAKELEALHRAPLVEPYSGPAIFRARAAGVYFHEILGHRLEGHRQKLEEEGQTFTKKLGKPVTADFISVYDDPALDRFKGAFLRGSYKFDDEGVSSRRAPLIEGGILKGFLMSRSPIRGFPASNGHGRRSAGNQVVARMGNIMVETSKTVGYPKLREMLIEEIKKQGKPYGLIFADITGGFTNTSRWGTQSFKVIPVLVYRVYSDARPDEAVRGVDIVGTPLASFEKITAAGDDYDIFNGTCGAESGWVPVSAVAPSLLVSEIEVEKKIKFSEKPPILPPPFHDPLDKTK